MYLSTAREWVNHAEGTLIGVCQRKDREQHIILVVLEEWWNDCCLRCDVVVGEHHALRLRCCARGVDDCCEVVRLGNTLLATCLHILRDDIKTLGADYDVHLLQGLFRELGVELVGNEDSLSLGMLDDKVELGGCKVGEDRYGNHARSGHRKV